MGIGGLKGSFYWASIRIMQVLRDNKDSLWMLLEAILNDPIVDWAAERHERAARKVPVHDLLSMLTLMLKTPLSAAFIAAENIWVMVL